MTKFIYLQVCYFMHVEIHQVWRLVFDIITKVSSVFKGSVILTDFLWNIADTKNATIWTLCLLHS